MVLVGESASMPSTLQNNPVVDNHGLSPAGPQFYFKPYFPSTEVSSNKIFVCVNFDFNKTITLLRQFEETFANRRDIYISVTITQITQNATKSFLPTFLAALCFPPITIPKADELDMDLTEALTEWNPNRVARV